MGVTQQAFEILIKRHLNLQQTGELLTLGRQSMHGTYAAFLSIMQNCGRTPQPLPETALRSTEMDRLVWAHLGYRLTAMDISDYENADVIHDLNFPVSRDLHGRFDALFDGGTTEHIFDVRQSLCNIVDLVKTGGRVIHAVPTNNQINHGFYQFSPTLYFDYYAANGFTDMRADLVVIPTRVGESIWSIVPYNHETDFGIEQYFNTEETYTAVYFSACKGVHATNHVIPSQKWYKDGRFLQGKQLVLTYGQSSLPLEPLSARG